MRLLQLLNLISPFEFDEVLGRVEFTVPLGLLDFLMCRQPELAMSGRLEFAERPFTELSMLLNIPDFTVPADDELSVIGAGQFGVPRHKDSTLPKVDDFTQQTNPDEFTLPHPDDFTQEGQ
jgi:uncharacterized membrane protein YkgB